MPQLSTKEGMIFNLQDSICTLRKDVARVRQKRVEMMRFTKICFFFKNDDGLNMVNERNGSFCFQQNEPFHIKQKLNKLVLFKQS